MNKNLERLLRALPDDLADDIREALTWFGPPLASPKHDLRDRFDELGLLDERELAELHAHLCRWTEFYDEQSIRTQAVAKRTRRRLEEQRLALKTALRRSAPQMPRDEVDEHVLQDKTYSALDRVVSLLDDMKVWSEHKAKTTEGQVQTVSRALTGRQIELERERIENNVPARWPVTRLAKASRQKK
jgi:hypothetical protein